MDCGIPEAEAVGRDGKKSWMTVAFYQWQRGLSGHILRSRRCALHALVASASSGLVRKTPHNTNQVTTSPDTTVQPGDCLNGTPVSMEAHHASSLPYRPSMVETHYQPNFESD